MSGQGFYLTLSPTVIILWNVEEWLTISKIFKSQNYHQVLLNHGNKFSSVVLLYYAPVSILTYTCDIDKIDTGYKSNFAQ